MPWYAFINTGIENKEDRMIETEGFKMNEKKL